MSIDNMLRHAGIATEKGPFAVGDRVQHYGTRRWAVILQILPQHDQTLELEVLLEDPETEREKRSRWWASYHVGNHVRKP